MITIYSDFPIACRIVLVACFLPCSEHVSYQEYRKTSCLINFTKRYIFFDYDSKENNNNEKIKGDTYITTLHPLTSIDLKHLQYHNKCFNKMVFYREGEPIHVASQRHSNNSFYSRLPLSKNKLLMYKTHTNRATIFAPTEKLGRS